MGNISYCVLTSLDPSLASLLPTLSLPLPSLCPSPPSALPSLCPSPPSAPPPPVTPSDYQPPGFVSSDGDELRNITDSVNIAVGDVATVGACTGVLCACTASAHPRPPLFPLPPSSSPSLLPPPPVPPPPPLAYVVLPQQPFHM